MNAVHNVQSEDLELNMSNLMQFRTKIYKHVFKQLIYNVYELSKYNVFDPYKILQI